MENVLDVYERPYDPLHPVINLDESPKQLIGQVRKSFTASDGTIYQDYEYQRNGTTSIYMVVEALRGWRKVFVRDNHKAITYAEIITHLAREVYSDAPEITLIEDNLSAHKLAALYEILSPEEARSIIRRINVVRTPKHGSWLNIAECELSVLTRCGLKPRTPTVEQLRADTEAWYAKRNKEHASVDWQFTTNDARIKLKRLYPKYKWQIQT